MAVIRFNHRIKDRLLNLVKSYKSSEIASYLIFFVLTAFLISELLQLFSGGQVARFAKSPYDDSLVDTSNFQDAYRDRMDKLSDIIDQRNFNNNNNKIIIRGQRKSVLKDNYLIVMYTKVFGQDKLCNYKKSNALNECPYKNCEFSCDRGDLPKAGALVFSERDLSQSGSEETYDIKKILQANKNRKEQIWILWNDEPTISEKMNKYKFNWTMSYRVDAEISDCSYGCTYTTPQKKNQTSQFKQFVNDFKLKFYQQKLKAVWAVSNCQATDRMKFALQLSQHLPVTVVGKCANYFMNPNSWIPLTFRNLFMNQVQSCPRNTPCERDLFSKSKFYFSFESYDCQDYLTEKVWRILRTDMIPVVMQPSRANYNLFLPADSFIHAEDFGFDARRLADYLKLVQTDFKVYLKHHAWKFEYSVVFSAGQAEKRRLCEMCTKLNEETSVIYYERVGDWFNNGCRKS